MPKKDTSKMEEDCSLGRWAPWSRTLPSEGKMIEGVLRTALDKMLSSKDQDELFYKILTGKLREAPFNDKGMGVKAKLEEMASRGGFPKRSFTWRKGQEIDYAFLGQLASWLRDPDAEVMKDYEEGVRVGAGVELARTKGVAKEGEVEA